MSLTSCPAQQSCYLRYMPSAGEGFASITQQNSGVSVPSSLIPASQATSDALSLDSRLLDEIGAIVKQNNANLLERETAFPAARPKARGATPIARQSQRARERRRFVNEDRYQREKLMELLSYAGQLLSSGRISPYTYARLVAIASSIFIEAHAESALARYASKL